MIPAGLSFGFTCFGAPLTRSRSLRSPCWPWARRFRPWTPGQNTPLRQRCRFSSGCQRAGWRPHFRGSRRSMAFMMSVSCLDDRRSPLRTRRDPWHSDLLAVSAITYRTPVIANLCAPTERFEPTGQVSVPFLSPEPAPDTGVFLGTFTTHSAVAIASVIRSAGCRTLALPGPRSGRDGDFRAQSLVRRIGADRGGQCPRVAARACPTRPERLGSFQRS
jgi:hypothetical protein